MFHVINRANAMNQKQLEYLKKIHSNHLFARVPTEPQLLHHIRRALVNAVGTLKLRSCDEIVRAAGQQMSDYSHNSGSELPFTALFHPPASYLAAKKEHDAAVKDREARIKKYRAVADDLMRDAELDGNADAKAVAVALEAAARAAGLIV